LRGDTAIPEGLKLADFDKFDAIAAIGMVIVASGSTDRRSMDH
jgi:hypothetical protein